MIRHILAVAAVGALAAPQARAQSSRPGAAAIAAAHHAVEATDAHTVAMTTTSGNAVAAAPVRVGSAAQSRPVAPPKPVAKSGASAAPAAGTKAAAKADSAPSAAPAAAPKAGKNTMTFSRETYSYAGGGRRDPFKSLLAIGGELRPVLSDLKLVTIVYGANGQNSVAILRDLTTKEQYRVRVGQVLGRMRVAAIDPRQVTFTIEEFGYNRQETLMYNDPTTMRAK